MNAITAGEPERRRANQPAKPNPNRNPGDGEQQHQADVQDRDQADEQGAVRMFDSRRPPGRHVGTHEQEQAS